MPIYVVLSNFTEQGRTVQLTLTHRALGEIAPEHREGVVKGWQHIVQRIKDRAKRR